MKYSNLNSSDKKLVDEFASLYVESGGDSEGFTWIQEAIKEKIAELENEIIEQNE